MVNILQNICPQKCPDRRSVALGERQDPGLSGAAAAARVADTEGITGLLGGGSARLGQGCTPEAGRAFRQAPASRGIY